MFNVRRQRSGVLEGVARASRHTILACEPSVDSVGGHDAARVNEIQGGVTVELHHDVVKYREPAVPTTQ